MNNRVGPIPLPPGLRPAPRSKATRRELSAMDVSPATARPELVRRAHLTRWLHTPREPPSGGSTLLASDQMKRCSDPCAHSFRHGRWNRPH
jgi:hypothetical protein